MGTKVTIYTVNGFMGDMMAGPQADTGRWLSKNPIDRGLGLADWQPIGYNAGSFPLSGGVTDGLRELQFQMQQHSGDGSDILISSWSEGSIISTVAYYNSFRGLPGWPNVSQWKGATTFGNPYRGRGHWAPRSGIGSVPDPGGSGIGGPRNNMGEGSNPPVPSWWHDYAHPGDMYTCCPDGGVGDDIRIIFDFVLTQWGGAWGDIMNEVMELVTGPLSGAISIVHALAIAMMFYGGGTREHVNYDPHPSMNYLAGVARSLGA